MKSFLRRALNSKMVALDPGGVGGFCRVARLSRRRGYVSANMPKSGGSSMRACLVRTEAYLDGERVADGGPLAETSYFRRFNTDLGIATALAGATSRGRVFTMARNPFARALSAYFEKVVKTYRMLDGEIPVEKRDQRTRRLRDLGLPLDRRASFEAFLEGLQDIRPAEADQHFAPQSYLLGGGVVHLDGIGYLERFDESMDRISAIAFGEESAWRRAEVAAGAERNINYKGGGDLERILEQYTERAVDLAARYYEKDFALLGYEFDVNRAREAPTPDPIPRDGKSQPTLALMLATAQLALKNKRHNRKLAADAPSR